MAKKHSFHIPVMGTGFTIDTPFKVAQYGIDSVISLVDDILIEKIRKVYCEKLNIPYKEINEKIEDFRAKRITSYLNLINEQTRKKFDELINISADKSSEIKEYLNMLPNSSKLISDFKKLTDEYFDIDKVKHWLNETLSMGSIDVNIMTKLDKENYRNGEKLSAEYNDAHAALRGFAESDLESSIILSAGMNPRLYSYIEQFEDFFPDESGYIKKKIIIKVSDYRSALIQGKFLAKKGLWVSEYRIESGLNCGGHAFATEGYLMGPILEEFRDNRNALIETTFEILENALREKNKIVPESIPIKISAQGGVGTAEEHEFLINHYNLDSVGWGSPFLLVPEVTNTDENTLNQLKNAKEDDLYLSNISPLGVPFNSLRGNTKDIEKLTLVKKGRPGSSCPKKYLISDKSFTEKPICTASRQYQHIKLNELEIAELSEEQHQEEFEKIVDKSCICVGLGTSALLLNKVDTRKEGEGVTVCPGPNMAYFSKLMSLKDIVDHIYGRINVISRNDRPNMFVKELNMYIDFLANKIEETKFNMNAKQEKYLNNFTSNLLSGIDYYNHLFNDAKIKLSEKRESLLNDLNIKKQQLNEINLKLNKLSPVPV